MGGSQIQVIQAVSYAGKLKFKGANASQKRHAKRRNNIRVRSSK
jgi:hypothetical protein